MSSRPKITVVGAGNVGATLAHRVAQLGLGDVVLVDIVDGLPQGKALDMMQSGPVEGYDSKVIGTNDYEKTAGSDVVVITSGIARKPGMSRDDLLRTNAGIVADVTKKTTAVSPEAILMIVTNPLDAVTYVAHRVSGFPASRVVGMAGVLDSARFRTFLAMELDVSPSSIQAMVLGGHGDTMVPLVNYTTVSGVPVANLLAKEKLDAIIDRTRNGGAEIVGYLKTGSAFYAPGASAAEMVESILRDRRKVLPCAALCDGEYGVKGLFVGVPVVLGRKGVESIVTLKLTVDEEAAFKKSADAVEKLYKEVDGMMGWK